ncbi:MAG: pentapeptide repeat-containing protein [Caldilineaceae bacterium]
MSGIKLHNIEVDRFSTTTNEDREQKGYSYHVSRNLDLSGLDFTGSQFTDVNLWELNLTSANLTRCFFGQDFGPLTVIFNAADLSYAEFHGCPSPNRYGHILAKFENSKLYNTRFVRSNKASRKYTSNEVQSYCGIQFSQLKGADLRNADLSGIDKEIRFDPRDVTINYSTKLKPSWQLSHQLIHQGLRDQNLRSVDLSYTTMIEIDFSGRDLSRSNFTGTWLFRSKFVGARLVNAIFVSADLADADFTDADLRDANFKSVSFDFCITKARLDGANLRGASLWNADLTTVTLNGAIYDQYTSWPDGFDPAGAGAHFIETKDE